MELLCYIFSPEKDIIQVEKISQKWLGLLCNVLVSLFSCRHSQGSSRNHFWSPVSLGILNFMFQNYGSLGPGSLKFRKIPWGSLAGAIVGFLRILLGSLGFFGFLIFRQRWTEWY